MEETMRRNGWRLWVVLLLAAQVRPGHGGDAPQTVRYLRAADRGFATECTFRIARDKSGWTITSRTERGPVHLLVETRYDADDQPMTARVVLTQGAKDKTAKVLVKGGKATVTREGQPSVEFDAPKGTIVTSAPDWTDVFLLCRHYDRQRNGKQEFPALWIHPTQPHQRLTFSIELRGRDTIEHDGKKIDLGRYEIRIRGGSRYVAWADAQGRMVRLVALPFAGPASGLTLDGYEKSAAGLRPAADGDDKPRTPAEQYQGFLKEFNEAARGLYLATNDEQRRAVGERVYKLTPRLLELAERSARDPIALDILVQVVLQEIYLQNNTTHPGWGKDSPEKKAIALLLRDHVRGDRLDEACRRMSYGFRRECETFLRTVLEKNPHREVQGLACLRLAKFLHARLQRLDLLKERPDMARRYVGLFGKDYVDALAHQDRARALQEIEALFARAADTYGDLKLPYGGTVGQKASAEVHELRHLSVGKTAPDIDGLDQHGQRFKLSDYRGKAVLLYFWSEY
jgi:hypothetical protein